MSSESAIVAMIAAQPTITAIIAARVYPVILPEDYDAPAVQYTIVDGPRTMTQDGPVGLVQLRVQFDLWATTYAGAAALRDAFCAALNGHEGVHDGTHVHLVEVINEGDAYQDPLDSTDSSDFGKRVDCYIWLDAD
jgi:hypothetical protein